MVRKAIPLAAAALLAGLATTEAVAGQIVRFEDGRSMEVEGLVPRGEMVELSLAGGGAIAVPAWRIVEWVPAPERPEAVERRSAVPGKAAWRHAAGAFAPHIERAAEAHRVDPILLTAVATAESAFDPRAISPKGASGLMQLMPQTARRFGVTDVFDAAQNVQGGARYLSWLLDHFDGDTELALAGYNAGEGAVERYKGIPPYPETERYVDKVLREAARLAASADPLD